MNIKITPLQTKIGEELRRQRKSKQLTIKQVAERTGLAQPNLSNIENGRQNITIFTLDLLAKVYEVQPIISFRKLKS